MSDGWCHDNASDEYEEFSLESTHLFRRLFIANDLFDRPQAWEPVAKKLLADPRHYLEMTRAAWNEYNRGRGDCFGNFQALEIKRLDPLTVRILCSAYYANGFPCDFSVTFERDVVIDMLVGH
ncbi:MAG: hypothetical protein H0W78_08155 [Planctomycetes bacterium]|nr:hypothetical protein [Planctomycetota bacterium]